MLAELGDGVYADEEEANITQQPIHKRQGKVPYGTPHIAKFAILRHLLLQILIRLIDQLVQCMALGDVAVGTPIHPVAPPDLLPRCLVIKWELRAFH